MVLPPFSSWMLKLSFKNLKTPTFLVRRLCLAAKAESLGRWCPYLSQFYPCSARLSFCPSASRYHNHNQIVLQGMRMPNHWRVSKEEDKRKNNKWGHKSRVNGVFRTLMPRIEYAYWFWQEFPPLTVIHPLTKGLNFYWDYSDFFLRSRLCQCLTSFSCIQQA